MRIDAAGFPFIIGAVAAAALAGLTIGWGFAIPLLVVAGFFLFFFRDPERQVSASEGVVLSPADGRVLVAGPADSCRPTIATPPPPTNGAKSGSITAAVRSSRARSSASSRGASSAACRAARWCAPATATA
jgi:hypothetical protein